MNLRTAQQESNHAWDWKPSQLIIANEVMDLGDPAISTLVNQHNAKLQPKYLSLYLGHILYIQYKYSLTPHQENTVKD